MAAYRATPASPVLLDWTPFLTSAPEPVLPEFVLPEPEPVPVLPELELWVFLGITVSALVIYLVASASL